jgi:glycosyltransferase involved in cell wall biosynthesis
MRRLARAVLPAAVRRRLGFLREALVGAPSLPRVLARARHARGPGPPAVYYGFDHIPGPGEPVQGGLAKLQALQGRHPNAGAAFNLVYLVSSAVPRHADALVRIARQRGARLVWNQNGVSYPGWQPADWKRTNRRVARLMAQADYVFYQSAFCRQSADRFLGPCRGGSEVLHNAVDTGVFRPAPPAGHKTLRLRLLLGGTQMRDYRVAAAVETLGRLVRGGCDAELRITGRLTWAASETEARAWSDGLVARLGLTERVSFTGPYSQAEAPRVFQGADVLLHTQYNDACPGVVVEAMACGLPIVYSASGGVPELVGPDAGIGIPTALDWEREIPPDPSAMADAVAVIAAGRERYAAAARARAVAQLDVARWLERHDDVFARLAGGAP